MSLFSEKQRLERRPITDAQARDTVQQWAFINGFGLKVDNGRGTVLARVGKSEFCYAFDIMQIVGEEPQFAEYFLNDMEAKLRYMTERAYLESMEPQITGVMSGSMVHFRLLFPKGRVEFNGTGLPGEPITMIRRR